ncbi:MAG: PKD domain-containing protein [Crocinitomicaceae bacterium]|nr:PKD domain-containing protein [Crocinitomicaceae bacterium]
MRSNGKTAIWILTIGLIIGLVAAIIIPSSVDFGSVDFFIEDTNNDYQYEVGESLNFTLSDSSMNDRSIVWYFGNGDTLSGKESVEYRYKKEGKYMVTLELDTRYKVSKFIDVIQTDMKSAADSIAEINGPDLGYVGEELIFSSYGPGVESWFWEFGETGNVDAYEGQVVYVYREPGVYTVRLKTNIAEYPVEHKIEVLSLFEAIEESDPVDSFQVVQNDIRRRLQSIANGGIDNKRSFYDNIKYIEKAYTCGDGENVVVVVNGNKYNDLYSYCQGLHSLEGRGENTLTIDGVKVKKLYCVRRIEVTQSVIERD